MYNAKFNNKFFFFIYHSTLHIGAIDGSETQSSKSQCSTPFKQRNKSCSQVPDSSNDNIEKNISRLKLSSQETWPTISLNSPIQNNTSGKRLATNQLTSTPINKMIQNMNVSDRLMSPSPVKPCMGDLSNKKLNNDGSDNNAFTLSESPKSHSNQSLTSPDPCSPYSPLYSTHASSKKSDKKQNRSRQMGGKGNSDTAHIGNNEQKNKKVDHNRSFSLGDFLTIDNSSKKNNKRDNSRVQSLTSESLDKNDTVEANKSLNGAVSKKKRTRRRIKPTKLSVNISAGKNIFF